MLSRFKKELEEKGVVYLKIKARPGASKNEAKDVMEDETIKINVSAPPVGGRANKELINFLAQEFCVRKDNIKMISGASEKTKLIKLIK